MNDAKNGGGFHMVTFFLLVIGGLNWLLVGLFKWDLVAAIFGGTGAAISRIIYILVGLSALYEIFCHKNMCKLCGMEKKEMPVSKPA